MHVLFIILLICKVHAQISESKYIDLLPEKEKTEFLEKIARRILEEVQEKNGNLLLKNGEVPDAELDKNDEYVAKADKDKENIQSKETLNIKAERSGDDHSGDMTRMDSRNEGNGKRRIFAGFVSDEDNSEKHENYPESDVDIQVKNFKINNKKYEQPFEITTLTSDDNSDIKTSTQTRIIEKLDTETTRSEFKLDEELTTLQAEINEEENETVTQSEIISQKLTIVDDNSSEISSANSTIENRIETYDITTENQNTFHADIVHSDDILLFNDTSSPNINSRVLRSYNEKTELSLNQNTDLNKEIKQQVNETPKSDSGELADSKVIQIKVTPTTEITLNKTNSEDILTTEVYKQQTTLISEKIAIKDISTGINHNEEAKSFAPSEEISTTGNSKQQIISSTENTNLEKNSTVESDTTMKTEDLTHVHINKEITTTKLEILTTTDIPRILNKSVNKKAIKELINNEINSSASKKNKIKKSAKSKVHNRSKIVFPNKEKGKYWYIHNLTEDTIITLRESLLEVIHKNTPPLQNEWKIPLGESVAKEYKVYEVPSDVSPFVKKETTKSKRKTPNATSKPPSVITKDNSLLTKEQLNYVPIHDYAPRFAFFDPSNIYEPSPGSNNEKNEHDVDEDINANDQENDDNGDQKTALLRSSSLAITKNNHRITKEQLNYVPIHDYAPRYAFFDPSNIYEPSPGSNNEKNEHDVDEDIKANDQENDDIGGKNTALLRSSSLVNTKNSPRITGEQPHYVPIYNFAASNAFFDPYNVYYGPNTGTDNDQDSSNIEVNINDNIQDDSDSNTISKYDDNGGDSNTINKNAIENNALKYVLNYLLKKSTLGTTGTPEAEREPFKRLTDIFPRSADSTDFDLSSEEYLGLTYSNVKKVSYLRKGRECNTKKKCVNKNKNKNANKNETEDDDYFPTKPKYSIPADQQIRSFLAEKNYSSFYRPKFTKDIVAELEDIKEKKKEELAITRTKTETKDSAEDTDNKNENNVEDFRRKQKKASKKQTRNINDTEVAFAAVRKIFDMTPTVDLVPVILKMLSDMKISKTRRNNDINAYTTVMEDMLKENNKALAQYGWLETTVDIQSAILKTSEMIKAVSNNERIHPSDLDLLKYLIHLYASAKELKSEAYEEELRGLLSPTKKRVKKVKESVVRRVWLIKLKPDSPIHKRTLKEFEVFINDLQNALYDLHTATKYIGMITKYRSQQWFQNLKQLYLDPTQKQLLELILHIFTSRVFWEIEDVAKKGLEDYAAYEEENEKEINRITEDFIFVLELLDEIKLRD